MAELKPINGHTKGMAKIQRYLEGPKAERLLAQDFLNLISFDKDRGLTWGRQMEITREEAGNDKPWHGKSPITFKHYVISPDPRDHCDLETLREVVMTWVRENFADYEVAVCYHDDNAGHILHAHVVVNNTNLVTGKRLSSELTKSRAMGLNSSLQNLCLEHGLSAFAEDHASMNEAEMASSGKNVSLKGDERGRKRWRDHREGKERGWAAAAPQRRASTRASTRKDIRELGIIEREGTSWKEEIRERVDVARRMARSERELVAVLKLMGVGVKESAGGDLLFTHPDGGGRSVRGARLGPAYSRGALRLGFSSGYVDYMRSGGRGSARSLSKDQMKAVARSVSVIGRVEGADIRAKDVARLLDYTYEHQISGYEGFGPDKRAQRMLELARRVHLFDARDAQGRTSKKSEVEVVAEWISEKRGPSRPGRPQEREEVVGYEEPMGQGGSGEPEAIRWKER